MVENKPNYYAIIPASVRYDKELRPNAKLIYGEITALSNEKGYCWASNNYFANLYDVTPQAASGWIKSLERNKHIFVDYIYGDKKEVKERRIYINRSKGVVEEVSSQALEGYQQKFKDNNTVINNTDNKKKNNKKKVVPIFYGWRKSISLFREYEHKAVNTFFTDEWLKERERELPNIDIVESLNKKVRPWWQSEDGWANKKKSSSVNIDWSATYRKALRSEFNQIQKSNDSKPQQEKPWDWI